MVETLEEILNRAYPKPAEHDPVCHMAAHAACEWWGWHELEKEVSDERD